jgi:anti-sigma-K factor RskA
VNTQEYIESGIIETYVLGMTDAIESAELEQYCREYPDIKLAVTAFEATLEQHALLNPINPPSTIKVQLFESLKDEFVHPVFMSAPTKQSAKVFDIKPFLKYIAAASIILLVISGAMNLYLYTKLSNSSAQYQAILVEKTSLQANNQLIQAKALDLFNSMQMMTDPNMLKVSMPGMPGKEKNYATIFWDTKSKDVYILPNKLPQPTLGKQYQLWAMVDGKAVDAGMIGDCAGLCKMKNIPNATMFAVTLEKMGGSSIPTMTEMYLAGKVS